MSPHFLPRIYKKKKTLSPHPFLNKAKGEGGFMKKGEREKKETITSLAAETNSRPTPVSPKLFKKLPSRKIKLKLTHYGPAI